MEAIKALIFTIIVLNLVSKSLTFFTGLSLHYNQFSVPFIDSSSHSEEKLLKYSQNQHEKT